MIHAASGGGIVNKNPSEATELIIELAESSRQFNKRSSVRRVNAASSSSDSQIGDQLSNLTSMMRNFMVGNRQQVKACEICSSGGHPTDSCPQLQEEQGVEVNAVGFGQPQNKYNPYSNTYNPGWKDHPNLRYGNQQSNPQFNQGGQQFGQGQRFGQGNQFGQPNQPTQSHQFERNPQFIPRPQGQSSQSSMSTEDMIRALTTNMSTMQTTMMQHQQETKSSILNLENQVGQLANAVGRLEQRDSGKFPSQPETNSNVSAVSLRNGRQLEEVEKKKPKPKPPVVEEEEEDELVVEKKR
ncbi:hypothetical protein RND81_06G079100 [Saponaria officinalis]|uniref:Uncharacterized protein n=1 Tax=Saponaria officinalis TaxID=3572 RepID=A0AAW1KB54_SAPOF